MRLRFALLLALVSVPVTWAATAPASTPRGDPAKAQKIVNEVCGACHGPDGNSNSPAYPNLAGQSAEYITKQLHDFKSGARRNAIMAPNVVGLTDEDMLNLGAYFAAQQPKPRLAKDPQLLVAGQRLYRGGNPGSGVPACAACHGPNGAGIPVQFPRLAGQHAKYVESQLKHFRSGDRANDGGSMMRVIARRMTDQEIRAVAEFVSGLR